MAPTIAGLAAWLQQDTPTAGGIVLVRAGETPPLFVVPSVQGTVMELNQVLSAMTTPRAVYGLQARGMDGTELPQTRIEDMAEDYLARIRAVQPQGPYALVGYSLGGLVVYEMARRLHALGEPVALVGLIDTNVSPRNLPLSAWLRFRGAWLRWLFAGMRANNGRDLGWQARAVASTVRRHVKQALGRPDPERHAGQHELPLSMQRVRAAALFAHARYRVPAYPGEVVFFRAALRDPRYCDPLIVWRRRSGSVEIRHVPGDHVGLREGAHARALAPALDASLARVQCNN
jgi:acetoacetyl-CoA synthetase